MRMGTVYSIIEYMMEHPNSKLTRLFKKGLKTAYAPPSEDLTKFLTKETNNTDNNIEYKWEINEGSKNV